MTTHDFDRSLAYSHEQADQPMWEEVYRQAFPDLAHILDLRHDGWHQRAGRDRAITLKSGRVIYVDEKVRREAYDDVALEVWSIYPKVGMRPYRTVYGAKPGWAREPKDCDWLAYAFIPTRTCLLFPFLGIRAAFEKYKMTWIEKSNQGSDGFRWIVAPNRTYNTISIAVPIVALQSAIADAMTVRWNAS